MAWDDCGVYGHPHIQTPNINKLANQGMRFDQAFLTISSCSPSRASIITGRYPHQTDAEQLHWPLPKEQVTFVELLKQAGYWTAQAGKWHLGEEVTDRFDTLYRAGTGGFIMQTQTQTQTQIQESGCEFWVQALQERPRDRPFFMWLAALDPHRPYQENIIPKPHAEEDVIVPPYLPDLPIIRKELALYYDEITRLDSYLGQVMDEIERQGVADNTLILFISDNGRPFPLDKTTLYDSGIRTPWIVKWPQKVQAGSVCGSLVSSIDIAPTFLALAGLSEGNNYQGEDFSSLLYDPAGSIREAVYAEDHWHDFEDQARAVRTTRFKYLKNYYPELSNTPSADILRGAVFREILKQREQGELASGRSSSMFEPRAEEELYDVTVDPFELNNLAADAEYLEVLDEMRGLLEEWRRETHDVLPVQRTADEFDRETGQPLPNRIRPRPSKYQMIGS